MVSSISTGSVSDELVPLFSEEDYVKRAFLKFPSSGPQWLPLTSVLGYVTSTLLRDKAVWIGGPIISTVNSVFRKPFGLRPKKGNRSLNEPIFLLTTPPMSY